jgi:SAM-dependent methyltransferase
METTGGNIEELERIYINHPDCILDRHYYDHLILHFERYLYAMRLVHSKSVIDAGCGTCYGSWLLSIGASRIISIDYDKSMIEYWNTFNFMCPAGFTCLDLDDCELLDTDIIVAFEVIEHLKNPVRFLKNIKSPVLIFSAPVKIHSKFHLTTFEKQDEIIDILWNSNWQPDEMIKQEYQGDSKFYYGYAKRRQS